MPRRPQRATGQFIFHVLNRAVQNLVLFEEPSDYQVYCRVLTEATERYGMRVLVYAVMPNHWHLVLSPPDDQSMSPFMKFLTSTHAQRWRQVDGSRGRGAVYQGRYKAIAVQHDVHFLRLCRYVERNPLRARLVARAEDWPWCSASTEARGAGRPNLAPWPIQRPTGWHDFINAPEPPDVLDNIRTAVRTGRHFGTDVWRLEVTDSLRWRAGLRRPGRPTGTHPSSAESQNLTVS